MEKSNKRENWIVFNLNSLSFLILKYPTFS